MQHRPETRNEERLGRDGALQTLDTAAPHAIGSNQNRHPKDIIESKGAEIGHQARCRIGKAYPAVKSGFQTPFDVNVSGIRSEEHTSELQSLMRTSYAVFCLKKKKNNKTYKELRI